MFVISIDTGISSLFKSDFMFKCRWHSFNGLYSDSSNSALICHIYKKSESYVDALQRLDTQCFGILRVKSGLDSGKC